MAANVKNMETMSKHLTNAERNARKAAEQELLPVRIKTMKAPKSLSGDRAALAYWRTILKRMDGMGILDELDTETLGTYCAAQARTDSLSALCRELITAMENTEDLATRFEIMSSIDGVLGRLQAHEKTLLSYAGALGLTPDARARLARKRAAQEVEAVKNDLFGD